MSNTYNQWCIMLAGHSLLTQKVFLRGEEAGYLNRFLNSDGAKPVYSLKSFENF